MVFSIPDNEPGGDVFVWTKSFKLPPCPTLIIIYIGTHANTRCIKGVM